MGPAVGGLHVPNIVDAVNGDTVEEPNEDVVVVVAVVIAPVVVGVPIVPVAVGVVATVAAVVVGIATVAVVVVDIPTVPGASLAPKGELAVEPATMVTGQIVMLPRALLVAELPRLSWIAPSPIPVTPRVGLERDAPIDGVPGVPLDVTCAKLVPPPKIITVAKAKIQ